MMDLSEKPPVEQVFSGYKFESWCSIHGIGSPFIWGYFNHHWTTCLLCHPEAEAAIPKDPRYQKERS